MRRREEDRPRDAPDRAGSSAAPRRYGPGRAPPGAAADSMSIRVLIADDQALVRAGFRMILDAEDDIEVVGEAADGAEARRHAPASCTPDVVLMDIRMPGARRHRGDPADRRRAGDGRVRCSCSRPSTSTSTSTRRCGPAPAGSCSRTCRPSSSPPASASSPRGDALLAPSITRRLIERVRAGAPTPPAPPPGRSTSSPRASARCSSSSPAGCRTPRSPELVVERDDGQDPRRARPHEARSARPRAGRRPRLRVGRRGPGRTGRRRA